MEVNDIENYYLQQSEEYQSLLLAMRQLILDWAPEVTEHWKYKLPFFYYKGKPFCYLYQSKKAPHPYIGISKGKLIDHPHLHFGNRNTIKVLYLPMNQDVNREVVYEVFDLLKPLY